MRMQTMRSQADGGGNGKPSEFLPLASQNSLYSLTLDEVQNQLGELGKPLSSMNLDELLKNVFTAEAHQYTGQENEDPTFTNQNALQRQVSLSLTRALSKKTVDEVWRDIQQTKDNKEKKSPERQPTLGEMTLEDFLVKAGIVAEASLNKMGGCPIVGSDPNVAQQFPQEVQWLQYPHPQYQHPQQIMISGYTSSQLISQLLPVGAGAILDVTYPENQVASHSPLMGTLSDAQVAGQKQGTPQAMVGKTVERRQKRMIKNRESAARSRARKQAYTNELENKVSRLEEENERLRKRKEMEKLLPRTPPEPKCRLRRTTSALF